MINLARESTLRLDGQPRGFINLPRHFFAHLAQDLLFPAFLGYGRKAQEDAQIVIVYTRGASLRNLFLVPNPLHFELCIP